MGRDGRRSRQRGRQGRERALGCRSSASRDVAPGYPNDGSDGPDPRASRRRGPGEDSTAGTGRRKAIPRYSRGVSASQPARGAARCDAVAPTALARPFDTPERRVLSSAGRRTRLRAHGRQARLRAFRGRMSTRGRTERIAHSPDEADLPAQEAPSREGARLPRPDADARRPSRPRRPAGSRSEATDGLTRRARLASAAARDALPSAGLRGAPGPGTSPVPPPPHRPVPADGPRDDPVRPVDRAQARRRRRPQPRPAPAPRGAQGDGALVPARLGRPDHRPAGDRRGRPRRPWSGRCAGSSSVEECSEDQTAT